MLDSLSLNPFKFSDAGKKKSSPFGFHMLKKGNNLFDGVTGAQASCSISGARWGIVNGVVTQFAANEPRIEDDGFGACPAFTQLAKYTEDLTNAVWSRPNILTPVLAGTFQGMNIWDCSESTATAYHSIIQNQFVGVGDNSVIGMAFVAKAKNRKLYIDVRFKNNTYPGTRINLENMAIEVVGGAIAHNIKNMGNGYCLVFIAYNVGAGSYDPYIAIQLYNGVSSQYTGDGVSGVYLGQPTYINFGVNGIPFIPPYIPNNTGSSVSVVSEAGNTSFDLDLPVLSRFNKGLRGPLAQGRIEVEVESNVDSERLPSGITTNLNIFTVGNNIVIGALYFQKTSTGALNVGIYDGTNNPYIVIGTLMVGQTFRISIDYGTYTDGSQKMRLTVNGVKSSVVAFSGSFGTHNLKFFYGALLHAFFIKLGSFRFIPKPIW